MTVPIMMALSFLFSLILGGVCLVLLYRQRRFRKPHDPKVLLYACRRDRCGFVRSIAYTNALTPKVRDALVLPLSEAKRTANGMIVAGYYVSVFRLVHPEHWREVDNG